MRKTLLEELFPARLTESFDDVAKKMERGGMSQYLVQDFIERFKALKDRGRLRGLESDITRYVDLDYSDLRDFLEFKEGSLSNREIRTQAREAIKERETKVLFDNEDWLALIPLSLRSSQKYGKGTKWCTAGDRDNFFLEYVLDIDPAVPIVLIRKEDGAKFGAAYDINKRQWRDAVDARDRQMPDRDFPISLNYLKKKAGGDSGFGDIHSTMVPFALEAYGEAMREFSEGGDVNKAPRMRGIAANTPSDEGGYMESVWNELHKRKLLTPEEEEEYLKGDYDGAPAIHRRYYKEFLSRRH